jgi:hypothetical protein
MSLTLTVSHNLYLSKEQRYDLLEGKEVEVVGASIPVWCYNGETSEPANEVFCKYKLIPSECKTNLIYKDDLSYEMELARNYNNEKDEKTSPIVIKSLADFKNGGSAWFAFRQYSKTKKHNKNVNIVHFVEIKDLNELLETII